ncbi:DEAD/DEAH box helicase [Candidatus Acetothermia bacterium]|jgi:DEAD/DEAH box helicase domain-containing protein|nr:DEAD/DEAH box helicase [Candidatus Acetothermia bacterium]MCI2427552.1 DEAD/DEAH box helicase [Candidatus Acetothermia bacterium]MCI2428403.1 DEAD/DEAH box helicase [Candidatus Acetothermia bacterium]
MKNLLDKLAAQHWYQNQVTYVKEIPSNWSLSADLIAPLSSPLTDYLSTNSISLYRHQVEAIELIRTGKDIIITTPTSSGKTLSFNLPIMERLLADPTATALYLYPMKALTNDQLQKLRDLERFLKINLAPATYDGDTPAQQRSKIREQARIILSNPHALHYYLPWHHKWRRFFANLQYIVIDEAHHYRGIFGTNVALLIRRLLRILHYYKSSPQLILSSASIANPIEYGASLTGRKCTPIIENNFNRGAKTVLFWNSLVESNRSIYSQAAQLLAFLTKEGLQTICFTISRAMAEKVALMASHLVPEKKILAYRAGYLPQERRSIEQELRQGSIHGVVATSALELGIDIGSLDAAILVGYPGSLISTWQQAGRAGRGTNPSLITFMAFGNPLDQYLLHHPDHFFDRQKENLVLNVNNPHAQYRHLACAAAELPLAGDEIDPQQEPTIGNLVDKGLLSRTPRGLIYRGTVRAHEMVNLDNISEEMIAVTCNGKLLEIMDSLRARRSAFAGAVLLHRGQTYVVETLNLTAGTATAKQENVDYHTEILTNTAVQIVHIEQEKIAATASYYYGRLRITQSFTGYRKTKLGRTIATAQLNLPPHIFESAGLWITINTEIPAIVQERLFGGIHGAEHGLLAMAPLAVLCDTSDITGVSFPYHRDTGRPTIMIFDAADGGIGITEKLFFHLPQLIKQASDLVKECQCDAGCPACLYSPHCDSYNSSIDKGASAIILTFLSQSMETSIKARGKL